MVPTTELVHVGEGRSQAALAALPVMDIETALERREAIRLFVSKILTPGEDFGVIPGTKGKPSLLKPGAEKLAAFFGLAPVFEFEQRIARWDDEIPFFHDEIKCKLLRDEQVRGEGLGSCNSRETGFYWRQAERVCPACGKPTIIKGKDEYGGGWLCFARKGGCGAKYADGDAAIEGQQTGRVPNPDICDQVNAILKRAKKRAFVDAVLTTTGASQFFTQDVEDMPEESAGWAQAPQQRKAPQPQSQPRTYKPTTAVEAEYQAAKAPPPTTPWDELGPDVPQVTSSGPQRAAQAVDDQQPDVRILDRESMLEQARMKFTSASTVGRITMFREAKKAFQNLLGKDPGEVRYQEWLMAADVSKPEDFKSLNPARDCYMHMMEQILQIGALHGV